MVFTVAPCTTQRVGATSATSSADAWALSVVCTNLGYEYDAGASTAVIVTTPAAAGVIRVEATPYSSLSTVQLPAPLQADKPAAGLVLKYTLAPRTAVIPSGASTRTT